MITQMKTVTTVDNSYKYLKYYSNWHAKHLNIKASKGNSELLVLLVS